MQRRSAILVNFVRDFINDYVELDLHSIDYAKLTRRMPKASSPAIVAAPEVGPPQSHQLIAEASQSGETLIDDFCGRCRNCNKAETPQGRRWPDGAGIFCDSCGLRKILHSQYCKLTNTQ